MTSLERGKSQTSYLEDNLLEVVVTAVLEAVRGLKMHTGEG